MEIFSNLAQGFAGALTPQNLMFALIGCVLGTLVGVLPGIGPTAGIAILLPMTAWLEPTAAIIMMAAIYYGAMYGGSTTAILLNAPGEAASVVTALDGHQMARQGQAGVALSVSAISSFVAGMLGLVVLTFFAAPLATASLALGPPERLGLMLVSLTFIVSLAGPSLVRGVISALVGVFFGMIGLDLVFGTPRFWFGVPDLLGGIDFISVAIGLFALTEVFEQAERAFGAATREKIGRLLPNLAELRAITLPTLRASVLGFVLGLFPGMSPGVVGFLAYGTERRFARQPERFGKGAIEGVATAEASNNAVTSGGFVPLLSFGIPPAPALAVLLGAFLIYGLQPGPLLFAQRPDIAWTVIASMYVGNIILLVLNLPLVGLWARIMLVPMPVMSFLILAFAVVGAYSVRNNLFDVWVALGFGVLGYLMRKVHLPIVPLVLGLIIGPLLETAFRQSLAQTRGELLPILARPGAAILFTLALGLFAASLYARFRGGQASKALELAEAED
jgi:putative tricarboxylic transport membrane protein